MSVEIIEDKKELGKAPSSNAITYQVPREYVKIPSKGLVYSKQSGLGKEDVEMRYMTAADEDDLTSPSLIRKGIWLTKLLQNCVVNKSFNVDNLLVGDRNALLFWLRQSAYGTSYELSIDCPACKDANGDQRKFNNEFKLNQLSMKTLDKTPVSEGTNRFEFVLPTSKLTVHYALMTGQMANEFEKEIDHQAKANNPKDQMITTRLKKQIISIDGVEDRKIIEGFISTQMPASDSLALRKEIELNTPDIDLKQDATCPHCGTTSTIDIPIEIQFFWPQSR